MNNDVSHIWIPHPFGGLHKIFSQDFCAIRPFCVVSEFEQVIEIIMRRRSEFSDSGYGFPGQGIEGEAFK